MKRFAAAWSKYRLYIAPAAFFGGLPGYPAANLADYSAHRIAACFASLTMGVYLLNKVTDIAEDERNPNAQAIERATSFKVLAFALPLMLFPPVYLESRWPLHFWLTVALLALGIWYCCRLPFFSRRVRLKDVLIVKNVVTAASWAAILILSPALLGMPTAAASAYFLKVFAIIMIIGVMWDVRDMEGDAQAGVRTIPVTWGIQVTKVVCVASLALLGATGLMVADNEVTFWPAVVATLIVILMIHPERKPAFYQVVGWLWAGDTLAVIAGWRAI